MKWIEQRINEEGMEDLNHYHHHHCRSHHLTLVSQSLIPIIISSLVLYSHQYHHNHHSDNHYHHHPSPPSSITTIIHQSFQANIHPFFFAVTNHKTINPTTHSTQQIGFSSKSITQFLSVWGTYLGVDFILLISGGWVRHIDFIYMYIVFKMFRCYIF